MSRIFTYRVYLSRIFCFVCDSLIHVNFYQIPFLYNIIFPSVFCCVNYIDFKCLANNCMPGIYFTLLMAYILLFIILAFNLLIIFWDLCWRHMRFGLTVFLSVCYFYQTFGIRISFALWNELSGVLFASMGGIIENCKNLFFNIWAHSGLFLLYGRLFINSIFFTRQWSSKNLLPFIRVL